MKIKSINEVKQTVNEEEVIYYDIVLDKKTKGISSIHIPAESEETAIQKATEYLDQLPETLDR